LPRQSWASCVGLVLARSSTGQKGIIACGTPSWSLPPHALNRSGRRQSLLRRSDQRPSGGGGRCGRMRFYRTRCAPPPGRLAIAGKPSLVTNDLGRLVISNLAAQSALLPGPCRPAFSRPHDAGESPPRSLCRSSPPRCQGTLHVSGIGISLSRVGAKRYSPEGERLDDA